MRILRNTRFSMNKGDVCMANKSANIVVRVEPEIKKKAEAILASLGMSPSSAINALYHQIIYSNGLPFSITLPPNVPVMEDMSEEDFNNMMKESLERADKGHGRASRAVFKDIRKKIY